jgi:hypothetical protein
MALSQITDAYTSAVPLVCCLEGTRQSYSWEFGVPQDWSGFVGCEQLEEANRLGYQETDIVDDENGARPVQEGIANSRSKPDAIGTPKPPSTIAGQCRVHSTALSQLLSVEKPRTLNRTNTTQVLRDEPLSANIHLNAQRAAPSGKERSYSIQSIQGITGI